KTVYDATINFFEDILKLMHPWMPFITEELWHLIADRKEKDCIIVENWPEVKSFDENLLKRFTAFEETVMSVRNIRASKNISPKEALALSVKQSETIANSDFNTLIKKLCNITSIDYVAEKVENATWFLINGVEFFIPLK